MNKTCNGCGYERSEKDAHIPEWECPSCSHAYVKTNKSTVPNKPPTQRKNLQRNTQKSINKGKHKHLKYYIAVAVVLGVISMFMNTNIKKPFQSSIPNKIKPHKVVKKSAKPVKPSVYVVSVKSRVTETNPVWLKYAWILEVRNRSKVDHKVSAKINFWTLTGLLLTKTMNMSW